MHSGIHKEMAYQVISDFPVPNALEFMLKGISKWKERKTTKVKWIKEWMDKPDNNAHSKIANDHSYKIRKENGSFKLEFAKRGNDQATVVARLKYAARSLDEWEYEQEYRACALELLKSIHWVVDLSSPSHCLCGWDSNLHSRIESHFDAVWKDYYDKSKIKFKRKNEIKDIYRWAVNNIKSSYDGNEELLSLYKNKGSIKEGRGAELGKEVIQNLAQNLVDYLHFVNHRIDFNKVVTKL